MLLVPNVLNTRFEWEEGRQGQWREGVERGKGGEEGRKKEKERKEVFCGEACISYLVM